MVFAHNLSHRGNGKDGLSDFEKEIRFCIDSMGYENNTDYSSMS